MAVEPVLVPEARNVDAASTTVVARPAYRIKRNFVVRHFVFRDVTKQNKTIDDINRHRHHVVKQQLDSFVDRLFPDKPKTGPSGVPTQRERLKQRLDQLSVPLVASAETFTMHFGRILQFRFRIRVDFHQEYITLTMLLDDFTGDSRLVELLLTDNQIRLSAYLDATIASPEPSVAGDAKDTFADFYFEDDSIMISSTPALDALYTNVWKVIDRKIAFTFYRRLLFLARLAGTSMKSEDRREANHTVNPARIVYLFDDGAFGTHSPVRHQSLTDISTRPLNGLTTRELERCYLASDKISRKTHECLQEYLEERQRLAETECLDSVLDRMVEFRGAGINLNHYPDCIRNPPVKNGITAKPEDVIAADPSPMQLFPRTSIERRRKWSISVLNSFLETRKQYFMHRLQSDPTASAISPSRDDTDPDNTGVFCLLHRGDALYGANLGHLKESEASEGSDSYAVDYFLIFHGDSSEQMGRLIRLLHVLGEQRHAALFDRKDLRCAGIVLRELANLWSVGIYLGDSKNDQRRQVTLEKELYFKYLTQLCCGDLSYRLGRADFYSRSFRERINDLGCLRIPGFQRYDDFIRRNLYPHFERHTSIQRRYESTQGAMQYLDGKKNLLSDQERQGSIDALTAAAYFISLFAVLSLFNDLLSHFKKSLSGNWPGLNGFIVSILFGTGFSLLIYIAGRFLLKLSQRICMLIAVLAGVLMIVYLPDADGLLWNIKVVYDAGFKPSILGFFGQEPMSWFFRIVAIVIAVAVLAVAASLDSRENGYSKTEREAASKVANVLSDLRPCDLPSWLSPDPSATWWQRINSFVRSRLSPDPSATWWQRINSFVRSRKPK
jgi:hypothetical protein